MRKMAGHSGRRFAQLAGLSPSYVGRIERGIRPTVSPAAFVRICNALGLAEGERYKIVARENQPRHVARNTAGAAA